MSIVHIGKAIKEQFDKRGMTIVEFAKRINKSRENIYSIFRRKTVDTGLLLKISEVLEHDFFQYYSTRMQMEVKRLQEENTLLKEHLALLKKTSKQ